MRVLGIVIAIIIFCSPITVCADSILATEAVHSAETYTYLRERTNKNDAPEIDMFLKYLGLPPRLSWCAGFVIYNYHLAADKLKVKQPVPRIGRCATLWSTCKSNPIRYKTFTVDQVRLGFIKLQTGDMAIWRHGVGTSTDFDGHIGLITGQVNNSHVTTIEGNTMPEASGNTGNQREGGGVYKRNRYLKPSSFAIIGFIRT
jgi:hypothetical protein